ncbi:MAG: hypothetical protein VYA34_07485 [Myxococcota bacterium]|nr:hypothetical protein [Myxococcota bacterium]
MTIRANIPVDKIGHGNLRSGNKNRLLDPAGWRIIFPITFMLMGGCSGAHHPRPLTETNAWTLVTQDNDPFTTDQQYPPPACHPVFVSFEDGTVEIDTGGCSWVTLQQPLLSSVDQGEKLKFLFYHNVLFSEEIAEAKVAIYFGDSPLWALTIPIPHAPQYMVPVVTLPSSFEKNTPVYFHVDNHGANSWNLGILEIVKPTDR